MGNVAEEADRETRVVRDEDDQELKRFASSFITEATLWSLSLSQRTAGDSAESFLQNSNAHVR